MKNQILAYVPPMPTGTDMFALFAPMVKCGMLNRSLVHALLITIGTITLVLSALKAKSGIPKEEAVVAQPIITGMGSHV